MVSTTNEVLIDRIARSGEYTDDEISEFRDFDRSVYLRLSAVVRRFEKFCATEGDLEPVIRCRGEGRHDTRLVMGLIPRLMTAGYRHTHFCRRCSTRRHKVVDSNGRPQSYSYERSDRYELVRDWFTRHEASRLADVLDWKIQLNWMLEKASKTSNVRRLRAS